ncbi:bactofilin family protein [Natranaeroarchaeum sulfidigenes]|uniref:Putative membrane protein related to bactofilin n=1 Tax=Natranaeroarchaeum sulfidigenes TaxID=2784880 RepID=A0A897MRN6_9EURY|nr:polymer-forming cytoskeletal protein [Natranaeroarchaeum sulfidigenes]QSG03082.1 putative membrane protein related to bactofilin [Natranaeroarchaeum sulfidigenes]
MRRSFVVLAVLALVSILAVGPAVVAADETRTGGTVVVEEGETAEDLTVAGGTVVIDGTVEGELRVIGGTVTIDGDAEDVSVLGGDVRITGDVSGDLQVIGGNVWIGETATVGGSVSIAAGSVTIDGTVQGDVEAGSGTITLGSSAVIDGDLSYAGELDTQPGAEVGGETTRDPGTAIGPAEYPEGLEWAIAAYALLLNMLLGAILLALGPRFSLAVSDRFRESTLSSAGVGLLAIIVVPIVLGLLVLSVLGIPIALVGFLLFAVFLWIATVYGRFAVGMWLLSVASARNRWLGLIIGLPLVALVAQLPYVGSLIAGLVTLVGVGAVTLALRDAKATGELSE